MALPQVTNTRFQTAEDVVSDIHRRIGSGEWPEGHRLPPERELAALYGLAGKGGGTLFGFLLLFGWLLTFLLAILQRIMPFLASMFVAPPVMGGSPIVSELAKARSLRIHAICHGVACTVLVAAILLENTTLARLGSAAGLLGAVAFAWFTADVIRRILPAAQPPQ